MFDLSPIQIVLVLVIALLALGPKRLPEMAKSLGRGLAEFRGAMSLDHDSRRDAAPPAPPTPPAPTMEAATQAPAERPAPTDHDVADLIVPAARPTGPPPDDE